MKHGLYGPNKYWGLPAAALLASLSLHLLLLLIPFRQPYPAKPNDRFLVVRLNIQLRHKSPVKHFHRNHSANLNKSSTPEKTHADTHKNAKRTESRIDLDAALAIARDFAKKNLPTTDRVKPTRFVHSASESQVTRWFRDNGIVERRKAEGWVVYFGNRRCILSEREQASFMQGMTIPMRCEIQTR